MDFDTLAYPDIFVINDIEIKGIRKKNEIMIPYTDEPDLGIGDLITQKVGSRLVEFRINDCSFLPGGTLQIGTKHPHLLTLEVENIEQPNKKQLGDVYHIASIHGSQVQVGNNNTQITNITIQELIENVAKTNDKEAKSLLKKMLENPTVASVLGAATAGLIGLL